MPDASVFLRKKKSANPVGWEIAPELAWHYGEQRRERHMMLVYGDIGNVFPSSSAGWTATERKGWGDGGLNFAPERKPSVPTTPVGHSELVT